MEEIQPKGGGPSFPFGCERKEEKESDSASGTLGGPRIREGRWKKGGSARRCGFLPPAGAERSDSGVGEGLALDCCGWRSEGVQGASGKPPASSIRQQLCRKQVPPAGPDAPTPARGQGLQPYGALTLFFRWRKKSVQKKASGTATPEAARPASRRGLRPAVAPSGLSSSSVRFAHPPGKRLLLPILTAGLAMSRAA